MLMVSVEKFFFSLGVMENLCYYDILYVSSTEDALTSAQLILKTES
jgi:hypothetical protein